MRLAAESGRARLGQSVTLVLKPAAETTYMLRAEGGELVIEDERLVFRPSRSGELPVTVTALRDRKPVAAKRLMFTVK